jgi:predicted RNA binding protein YcfA (HicA-like mRNA interferase family)
VVPVHPGDLKRPLVAGVLKDAEISREEFLRLL